jgi:hypothetical protein
VVFKKNITIYIGRRGRSMHIVLFIDSIEYICMTKGEYKKNIKEAETKIIQSFDKELYNYIVIRKENI